MKLNDKLKQFMDADYGAITEHADAAKAIDFLTGLHQEFNEAIEDAIAPIAVKFQIPAYLGEYAGRDVGEWMSSTENC